jgi:antitoxin ParD1/3/4
MVSVNVSLPDSLKELLEEKVATGGYVDFSQYFYHLICQDLAQTMPEDLEHLLLEGLTSGEPVDATDEWWEQKRTQLLEKHHHSEE